MEWKGNFGALTAVEREALDAVISEAVTMSNLCFNFSQCSPGRQMDAGLIGLLHQAHTKFDVRLFALREVARKSRRRRATK